MKKTGLVFLSLMLMAPVTNAQSISDALKKCGKEQNSLKRLVCYDRLVNELDKYSGLDDLMNLPAPLPADTSTAAGPNQSASAPRRPVAVSNEEANFGLDKRDLPQQPVEKISSTITKVAQDRYGQFIFTLANGMVWKQSDTSRFKGKVDMEVYIEKGFLGSHYMGSASVNTRMKVKRVK